MEKLCSFDNHRLHFLRRIRPERIRRNAVEHLSDREKSDKGKNNNYCRKNVVAEARNIELPFGHIKVCTHHSVGVHNIPCDKKPETHSDCRTDNSYHKRI